MMEQEKVGWSVKRRMEFIEMRLIWEGRVNRRDLIEFFRISVPQASADIGRYQDLAPGNLTYDAGARTFVPAPDFTPRFHRASADRYLAQLRSLAAGIVDRSDVPVGAGPAYDIVPTIGRHLETATVRLIVACIRNREAVSIEYQSFSHPEPTKRWVAPHAIAYDGQRWHIRSWCYEHADFRDFVIARIIETGDTRASAVMPADDADWNTTITLKLAPHPRLEGGRRKAVELDYGMAEGFAEVRVRKALLYYVTRQLGLDRDPDATPPEEYHVVLANKDEIEADRTSAQPG